MGDLLVIALVTVLLPLAMWSQAAAEWVALLLILIAGIPHGAFDLRVAEAKWLPTLHSRLAVLVVYISVGAAMSALCLIAPGLGLSVFLIVSVLHFAEGEGRGSTRAISALFGCGAVLCPIAFHTDDAAGYLAFFITPERFERVAPLLLWVARVVYVAALSFVGLDLMKGNRSEGLQRLLCLAAWVILPPLSGFAVWFIGRHSRQHLVACRGLFNQEGLRVPLDFLVISLLAIGLILPLSIRFNLSDIHELFAASIVLIAGLTLPHIVVSHNLPETLVRLGMASNDR